jgi:DNA-binding response OmpR family regulator
MSTILLVDDDRDLVDLLTFAIQRAGFGVLSANDAPAATALLRTKSPDLVVLDVNLGRTSGFDLLAQLRRHSWVPVILLTARVAEDDKVRGLELGADDYLTKPFSHRELIARVRAHLRRQGQPAPPSAPARPPVLEVGPLAIDLAEHRTTKEGQALDLTVTEFRVLHYLMLNAGTVVPTRVLLKHVWGYDDPGATDVVRAALHRLRRKLEDDPTKPRLLHTVPGVGILLKPEQG